MTATRSAMERTIGSWVTMTRARFSLFARSRNSSRTCRPACESRFAVGSSARRRGGAPASARAMATRCFCPPERSRGRNAFRSARPTASRTRSASLRAAEPLHAADVERVLDVLDGGEGGEEVELLEDEADRLPADRREVARAREVDLLAVDDDAPLGRRQDAAEDREERRLPGARGPLEGDDLAPTRVEGDPPQDLDGLLPFGEALDDVLRREDGHRRLLAQGPALGP